LKTCFKPCELQKRPPGRFALAAMALATVVASCASFEHLTQVSDTFAQAKECGKCHIDIYEEWSKSDHAGAYTNPHFQAATNNYAFSDCLHCHAPEPKLTASAPAIRAGQRDEGITCVACHLDQGALAGPLEPTGKVKPHPIRVYHDVGICGRCHQGTLEQWISVADEKKTCQECHMPGVTRKMTQSSGGFSDVIVAMEHETPQRRHSFAMAPPESVREMVTVEVRRVEGNAEVVLHNRLPHRLPTGDYGFRILVLEILALDENGTERSVARMELTPEVKTDIAPLGTWDRRVAVPESCVSLRVRLQRISYEDEAVLDLLDQIVEL
jgi:hypothetical protein